MATTQLGTLLRHIEQLTVGRGVHHGTDRQLLDDFAARRDEAAFAALMSRHGPMVWRVCRRVLHHEQDAEDAFQATFLILARNTASIRKRDTVGSWLHGVAYRTAMKARRTTARRRNHEARLAAVVPRAVASPTWDETQAVLDEEIQRLPACFRQAFVLCVLEGKGGAEAAAELGCKEGTVKSRVKRARRLLQQQLARRGIKLTALLAALSVSEGAARAALPAALARATLRFGLLVAAGSPAAEVIPAHVAALAAGVTRAMFLTKAKIVTTLVFAASLLTAAGALTQQVLRARETAVKAPVAPGQAAPAAAREKLRPVPADPPKEAVTYSGRVLDPAGKPVAGAKLYLTLSWGYLKRPAPSPVYATTGPDGRFRFTLANSPFAGQGTTVVATAAGHGPAWIDVKWGEATDHLTLPLVKDDVPIDGQILDLQGRPVPGAAVRVLHILAAAKEDLAPWRDAAKAGKEGSYQLERRHLPRQLMSPEIPDLPRQLTADANGRIRFAGIGRERMVAVQIEGPTIATRRVRVLTRPGQAIEVPEFIVSLEPGIAPGRTTYYGATFRHAAAPTKPVVGVIRDRDTKQPLAGVTVQSYKLANNPMHGIDFIRTTTDARGRYRLTGMPKGEGNKILAAPGGDQPYLPTHAEVADTPGLDPVTVDFELKRGVWVEGRVTDRVTGKPLQAGVEYFALGRNPHLGDYPGFEGTVRTNLHRTTRADGSFRVVALPGPGVLAVQYHDGYLLAHERDDEYGTKGQDLSTSPYMISAISYNAIARVDPPKGAQSVKRDVVLDPGETFRGTVLDPDGKPLAGARAYGLGGWNSWELAPLEKADFTVRAFNPHRPRPIVFQHREKGLVGAVEPRKGRAVPVAVRLQPGAAVTGRLVDGDGKPRANAELFVAFRGPQERTWAAYSPNQIKTDSAGRFRIPALIPGFRFEVYDPKGWFEFGEGLRSGETKDLGDVQTKRDDE